MTTLNPAPATRSPTPPRRMTVAEYEDLIESGVIDERAPVELIEGRIVGKMTKGNRHCVAAAQVQHILSGALFRADLPWFVWTEKPIALPDRKSMPEPDVALVRGRPADFMTAKPGPASVGLVVEIADSSLADDRRRMELYLAGGVPECWLLNLVQHRLEVHRSEAAPVLLDEGDTVELVLDARFITRIPVADLLPGRLPES
ncbi:Uma2 family endonuclease [Aquisphaera insulae]|uniref:Uma2 family endonuclease n=1 Tax=Aquisphaera insulae TaxID=2712864 RepID=UPI0013EC67CF|nr:Uma2 family endonuclease [Aquisphaera insulae]